MTDESNSELECDFARLRCAACKSRLVEQPGALLRCSRDSCAATFPVIGGVPVLINEQNSVFRLDDFRKQQHSSLELTNHASWRNRTKNRVLRILPPISRNLEGKRNYARFAELLCEQKSDPVPRILILGAGPEAGEGIDALAALGRAELVETDVAFGPTTQVICDAHDIPFEDSSFDAAVVQAVLEHVADPYRCVEEIYRVLKPDGLVYAETPFMQQVHMAGYDFTRFTHLGHRRLFRKFSEIDSGISCGPGMALAWSYRYFLVSFVRSKLMRGILTAFARLTSFFILYAEKRASRTPAAYDAASGFYFLGRKSESVLSDRDLVALYRGAVWADRTK